MWILKFALCACFWEHLMKKVFLNMHAFRGIKQDTDLKVYWACMQLIALSDYHNDFKFAWHACSKDLKVWFVWSYTQILLWHSVWPVSTCLRCLRRGSGGIGPQRWHSRERTAPAEASRTLPVSPGGDIASNAHTGQVYRDTAQRDRIPALLPQPRGE